LWDRRKGFARLAVAANAPVVPVACPAADDLYTVYENRLTKLVYKQLRFPIPAVRGFGPTLLPRPVELVHHVGQPIYAPSEGSTEARVDGLHAQVLASMKELLQR
jgi:1-acyl-sn-glycerol-3-phosphate acyltransferase